MNLPTRLVAEALMECEDEVHYILTPQDNGYRSQDHKGFFAKTIGDGRWSLPKVLLATAEKDGRYISNFSVSGKRNVPIGSKVLLAPCKTGQFPDEKDGIIAILIESAEKVTKNNIIFTKGSIIRDKDWKKLFL